MSTNPTAPNREPAWRGNCERQMHDIKGTEGVYRCLTCGVSDDAQDAPPTAVDRKRVSDAARAVGRFNPDGPDGYCAATMPNAPLRATRAEAEADQRGWLERPRRCICPVGNDAIGPHTRGCPNHPDPHPTALVRDPLARDRRVVALSKMGKQRLVAEFVRVVGRPWWSLHPIERWSKDELIADILRVERLA